MKQYCSESMVWNHQLDNERPEATPTTVVTELSHRRQLAC